MTVETPENPVGSIIARAKAILFKPKEEWPIIEHEATSSGDIFTRYAIPLAAIGPVATFVGGQLFGFGAFGIRFRPSFMAGLSQAIFSYVLTLVGLFVVAFVANKLAPSFGGESSKRNAFKLVVYSMTAGWVASIVGLLPSLGILALLASLYGIYLFYVGAGTMLKIPAGKAMTFTIVTVILVALLYFCIGALTAGIGRLVGFGPPSIGTISKPSDQGPSISIPGVGKIDADKIEQAAKDFEESTSGDKKAVAPDDLQALLPNAIGAYKRTEIESMRAGPGSKAEATYEAGDKSFTLKVSDIAFAGAMASLGEAFGVESNKEDADGYERTTTKGGNLVVEKWDRSSEDGSFMTMVGKRFMIEAEGDANSIDELKAAVASVDQSKLAALSKGG